MRADERLRFDTLMKAVIDAINEHAPITASEAGTIFGQLLTHTLIEARHHPNMDRPVADEMRRWAARIQLYADTPLSELRRVAQETADEGTH
jgi:hypothetical protein